MAGCLPTPPPDQTYYGFWDFSLQNFLLEHDMSDPETANDDGPMWLEKAA